MTGGWVPGPTVGPGEERDTPFVGADRLAVVDELLVEFDAAVRSGEPRLVTLEAGSGWGKTRLVHELYRRLAADRQGDPAYWPPSILSALAPEDARAGESRDGRRKRIYPATFEVPEGAVPHWFWWGITATAHRGGATVQAIAEDMTQVDAHAAGLEARWRELAGIGDKGRRALRSDDAADLADILREEGIGRAAEAILGSAVPGLGLLMWAGGLVWRQRDRWSGGPATGGSVDAVNPGREDLVPALATSISDLAAVGLPIVIVVEDAHEADESLIELLVRVVSDTGPIVVIATSWPGLLDEATRPAARLASLPAGRVVRRRQGHELADLAPVDLRRIGSTFLPTATEQDLALLAERFTVPLTLEIACELRRVRDAVADGDLTAEDLEQLPRDVEGLYLEVWRQLPEAIQQYLVLAALVTPTVAGDVVGGDDWDDDVVERLARSLDWMPDDVAATDLRGEDFAWVRRVDDWLRRFHEPAQLGVAAAVGSDELGRRRRRELYDELATLVDPDAADLTPPQRRWRSQLLVTLCAGGHADWDDRAQDALDRLIDEAKDLPDTASARRVVELVDLAPPRPDGSSAGLRRRLDRIVALADLGRYDEALEPMHELVGDWQRSGAHPESVVGVVRLFGLMMVDADRIGDAVQLYHWLLEDAETSVPPGTWLRLDLATALDIGGRTDEAIVVLAALIDDLRALGGDDPTLRQAQLALAQSLRFVGRLDEARAALVEMIAETSADEVDESIALRRELAQVDQWRGDMDSAVQELVSLAGLATASWGAADRRVLSVRFELHQAEAAAGRHASAVDGLELLAARSADVLGVDHLDTTRVIEELSACEVRVDRPGRAVQLLEQHLSVLEEHLPAGHVRILDLQGSLAAALVADGGAARAVALLGPAVEASIGARGADRIETLTLRARLRDALDATGAADAALEQEQAIAQGLSCIHGPEHPWTLEAHERVRRRVEDRA